MPAEIYSISIPGWDDGWAHPHVVVIQLDSEQVLCVPAYDTDGLRVNQEVKQLQKLGLFEGEAWVEIDNQKEVTFIDHHTGKLAKWMVYKRLRIEKKMLRKLIGKMSDLGLCQIVECLLKLHAAQPGSTLTQDELIKLKKLAQNLGARIPRGI